MDPEIRIYIILVVLLLAPAILILIVSTIIVRRRGKLHRQRITRKSSKTQK